MSELLEDEQDSIEEFEEKGSYWRSLHIVDTAGIRKKGNIHDFIEEQSVYRSLRCISEADIVVYMVDCTKGVGHQDRRLIDIALDKGKSVIICLNKFDLFKGKFANDKERREWLLDLRAEIPWLNYCDIIPISAKYGKSIGRLKQVIKKTIFIRSQKVSAGHLNRFIFDVMDHHGIVVKKSRGQRLKVKYASMIKSAPPTFLLYTNKSKGIPETYKRYLKNCIRQEYGIINTPVHLIFRTGTDLEKRMAKVKRK